jgi:CHAT domain-containing protein
LLADDRGFLAEDALLRFAVARRWGAPSRDIRPNDYRLGVGFMAAAPRGAVELDYEAEEAAILAAAPDDVDLFVEDSGDPKELGKTLSQLAPPLPVLHLSCHGHNAWRANVTAAPQAVLLMEDVHGSEQPTSAVALIGALEPYRPRLLFLSACLSAAASEGGAGAAVTDPLASTLVQAGLPCVLGWDGSVADVAATAFAQNLYDGLSRRQSIVEAAAGVADGRGSRRLGRQGHAGQPRS